MRALHSGSADSWREEMERRYAHWRSVISSGQRGMAAEWLKCSKDVLYWIDNYGWLFEPRDQDVDRREIPFLLWPSQRELVAWFLERRNAGEPALVNKSRSIGVSWSAQHILLWFFLFERGFIGKVGSRKEELVDSKEESSLFGKLRYILGRQPGFLRPSDIKDTFMSITSAKGRSHLVGESTNRGFSRGGRGTILFLDEFAHIDPPSTQASVWTATSSVAQSTWLVSTPNGPANKFAELYRTLPSRCVKDMYWTSDPRRPENFKQLMLKPIGQLTEDEFSQEYEAKLVAMASGRVYAPRRDINEYGPLDDAFVAVDKPNCTLLGSWDFGSGDSLLVCLNAIIQQSDAGPIVWVDSELVWRQTRWQTAAADEIELMKQYECRRIIHVGDPAGKQKEGSNQDSWDINLRIGGIPLFCLPVEYNTRDQHEWGFKQVNTLLAEGRLRINRRCEYLWSCLENWKRDTPPGVELDFVSRIYVAPSGGIYSHGGMALCYMIQGLYMQQGAYSMVDGTTVDDETHLVLPSLLSR